MLATWSLARKCFVSFHLHSNTTDCMFPVKDGPPWTVHHFWDPVFGLQQKSNRNKRQIFQVNADCPAMGWFCALQEDTHCLPVISFNACFFSNYPVVSSPSNTWMKRVLHIYIYWVTWGMELIYFGKWIWYLSSSSLFQIPFPGTGKLFAKPALFL